MVIGNGMIATAFNSYRNKDEYIIFASGVSQSMGTDQNAFKKEKDLLANTIRNSREQQLVYFGTCGVYDPSMKNSAYIQHKLDLENYIQQHQKHYTIFRLSNPIGKTKNNDTVVNFFIRHILEQSAFNLWKNASRNIIDIDDMYKVCDEILVNHFFPNTTINIANPFNYTVPYIIDGIEKHFAVKGKYTWIDKGDAPRIDISLIKPFFEKFNINFDRHYLERILQKYFPKQ